VSLLRRRIDFEGEEAERLAAVAVKSGASRGRVFDEPEHSYRTAFQRDRDRIVHSQAFRRLEYKTQVFVYHEGDHYRNRLTHTLEGGQIARTIARVLRLNEELAEAVVLAHDLGHTPFGHAGERVLNELLENDGGFDHNRQSLRIVDLLEERYPGFRGLNLTDETREGILKHGCSWEHPVRLPDLGAQSSLEAQVADFADEIAYINHDLDDGLRSGLLRLEQIGEVPLWGETRAAVEERLGDVGERVLRAQTIVALIDRLVTDLVESTARRLDAASLGDVDAVRRHPERLVGFSAEVAGAKGKLKQFLYDDLYLHPQVRNVSERASHILGELYAAYCRDSSLLPERVRGHFESDGEIRAIADYIAGMTDRFALQERAALTDTPDPLAGGCDVRR
jgi:dGTPase